jgi:hypothetical protein
MTSLTGLRRKTLRMTCSLEARAFLDGAPAIKCTIHDVTPDGARLVTEGKIATGDKILLLIPSIAEVWAADVRWRRGTALGVKFIRGEADLPGDASTAKPDAFALRLQVAQMARSAKRLSAA